MHSDSYLKLKTTNGGWLNGESKAVDHADEIDIYSWSIGESQQSSATGLSGQGMGRAVYHDFTFSSLVNKASAGIIFACATGDHVDQAILSCRKSAGQQADYLNWTLIDGLITSYSLKGDPDSIPSETFTIAFAEIKMDYKMQMPNGGLVAGGFMHYNVRAVASV
jgi:type VI secretion system secreted protein Hcp